MIAIDGKTFRGAHQGRYKIRFSSVAAGFLPEASEAVARTSAFIDRIARGRFVDGSALRGGPESMKEVLLSGL